MMTSLNLRPAAAAALVAVLLSACNLAPRYVPPVSGVPDTLSGQVGTPVQASAAALDFAQAQPGSTARGCAKWWHWP